MYVRNNRSKARYIVSHCPIAPCCIAASRGIPIFVARHNSSSRNRAIRHTVNLQPTYMYVMGIFCGRENFFCQIARPAV